jgi:metal-responsive CopG/Arc/MetJ family transcriptional regulator
MKKIEGNPRRISIIFTEDIIKYYENLCKETGASFSEAIRRALIHYIEDNKDSVGNEK